MATELDDLDLLEDEEDDDLEPAADASKTFRDVAKTAKDERKARRQAEQELERYRERERDLALREAGIDPESDVAELLATAHKGEWTGDAVKETVARYQIGSVTESEPDDPMAEAAARVDRVRGASQPVPTDPDPVTKAKQLLADGNVLGSLTTKVQALYPPDERM